jgi:hypothetical protein
MNLNIRSQHSVLHFLWVARSQYIILTMAGRPQMNRDEAKGILRGITNLDPVEFQYWMNQFVSDDLTQFDYDHALSEFRYQYTIPKYSINTDEFEKNLGSIWDKCITSVVVSKNAESRSATCRKPKSEDVEMIPTTSANAATSSTVTAPPIEEPGAKRAKTEYSSNVIVPNIRAAFKELGETIGGTLAAPPKKVTVSLTFKL